MASTSTSTSTGSEDTGPPRSMSGVKGLNQATFACTRVSLTRLIPAPQAYPNYVDLYDKPIGRERGLTYTGIPEDKLTNIGGATGANYSHGHLLKFGPRAGMAMPILVVDPCLLVVLRGEFKLHSFFGDGNETPTLLLEPDHGVWVGANTPVHIARLDQGTEAEDSFVAWLEFTPAEDSTGSTEKLAVASTNSSLALAHKNGRAHAPRPPRRSYTVEERKHAAFLLDVGFSPRKVAKEIGPPCTPDTVRRWQKQDRLVSETRRRLQKMLDDIVVAPNRDSD